MILKRLLVVLILALLVAAALYFIYIYASMNPVPTTYAVTLGDLDGDGRVDILAGWFEAGYTIWWNQGGGKFAR